jgi:hypothetical protein
MKYSQSASCETCRDLGHIQTEEGVAICVDCCLGIPFDDAKIIIRDYPDCDSFVCAHYEFYANGQGDNSCDLAKYWQRCKEIVENVDNLPIDMTNVELKRNFEVTGKTARDFIRWAAEKGVKVHDATVSRHLAGTQTITQPWQLAYLWFFSGI